MSSLLNAARRIGNVLLNRSYPATVATSGPNLVTLDFFSRTAAQSVAEIGIYEGDTSLALANLLGGRGELHLFDFQDRVEAVVARLKSAGHSNVVGHPNSSLEHDSYNWSLMKILRDSPSVRFDYVFLDGAHTWGTDALAFLLVDRLLSVGGHVDFDDYDWTLAASPSLNPSAFPRTAARYTAEQMETPQVRLIQDLLVRPDGRYIEVVKNRIYRKAGE